MTATTDTATLNIADLYYPLSAGPREVAWNDDVHLDGLDDAGGRYAYTEAFDFEHDGETFPMIARDGYAEAVIVDGRVLDRDDIENEISDAEEEAFSDDRDPDTDAAVIAWNARRDALDTARDDTPANWGSEGPIMNYFYPVSDYTPGTMEDWAAKIADLPLCVVELDEERGLALTGGGMDLSWEIAEAFIRLGYYPPTWLDLPAMAGRGTSANDRAIATALLISIGAETRRLISRGGELAERYGVEIPDGS